MLLIGQLIINFLLKKHANEYYNLALDRFYNAEDGNVWLHFPSSERNKVDEETYLILKKQHDNDVAVDELYRYKILSIQNEAPDFIATFEKTVAAVNDIYTICRCSCKTLKFNACKVPSLFKTLSDLVII
jgi:hypothetical protein